MPGGMLDHEDSIVNQAYTFPAPIDLKHSGRKGY